MNRAVFRHEAMATYCELTIAGQDEAYARQAAAAAFRELDRLEGELSRFIESSDISRANRLAYGDSIVIGDDALECLALAASVAEATGRAFDPAYASEPDPTQLEGAPYFALDPAAHVLVSRAARLQLDLGAVGKGYALDRLADVLTEWGIGSACCSFGGSTALALDQPPDETGWLVGLGEGSARREIRLVRSALSGSGVAVKGAHLLDPRSQRTATRATRAWAFAQSAALADALSTAFFVMTDSEVGEFCAANPEIGAALAQSDGQVVFHGALRSIVGVG